MPSPAKRAAATKAPPEGRPSPKTNASTSTALEIRPPSASIPGPENVRIELMRHHSRMEKLLQGTVEQIHQAVRQELESLRVKDIDARPMEASSSSISRNLPGMTLEAYFQAQEEKMEKKITKQRTFGSRHTEPAGDMENPLSTLEAWTGDHFPDAASENEEDETSMSQARKSRFNMLEKNKVKGVKDWLEHRKKSQIFMDEVPPWRRWAKHVVRNSKFEWLCAALILLCALMIGAEAHYQVTHVGEQEPLAFRVLNTCFNVAFTVELCLRIMVDQLFFFSCRNASIHWNLLDSILVSIAVVEEFLALVMSPALQMSGLKILRMVRLARILRIVRVVRFFSELRVMLNGVIGSGKSLCWALLLLVGVNFLFGVVFMQLSVDFLENSEASSSRHAELLRYFGSLPRTMLTLYQAISGGIDWYNAVVVLYPVGDWIEYIFSAYVFFTVFCCLNIVTGIFVDNAKALKVADEEAMHHEAMKERQKWITEVAELFSKISVEKDAKLTKDDFIYHVTNSDRINTCFYHLGINTETTNTDELWELFDMDANGVIDQDEFAIGIKQFHGFARSIDLFKLRKEVREILKQVNKMFLVEPE